MTLVQFLPVPALLAIFLEALASLFLLGGIAMLAIRSYGHLRHEHALLYLVCFLEIIMAASIILQLTLPHGLDWSCELLSYTIQIFVALSSVGVYIALAMQPIIPKTIGDDALIYSKNLNVNLLCRIKSVFYGPRGRFVLSWVVIFALMVSSLGISLTSRKSALMDSIDHNLCTGENSKGISFLLALWSVFALIVVVTLFFSILVMVIPPDDSFDDEDRAELGKNSSTPLLNTSDLSISEAAIQPPVVTSQSVRLNKQWLGYKVAEVKDSGDLTGSLPRRSSQNRRISEVTEILRANSGPLQHSASLESLKKPAVMSADILTTPMGGQSLPMKFKSSTFTSKSRLSTTALANHAREHSIVELAGGVHPSIYGELIEFNWDLESKMANIAIPILSILTWIPWILLLVRIEGINHQVLAYVGLFSTFLRQVGLSVMIQASPETIALYQTLFFRLAGQSRHQEYLEKAGGLRGSNENIAFDNIPSSPNDNEGSVYEPDAATPWPDPASPTDDAAPAAAKPQRLMLLHNEGLKGRSSAPSGPHTMNSVAYETSSTPHSPISGKISYTAAPRSNSPRRRMSVTFSEHQQQQPVVETLDDFRDV
ncbi:MAG: hypothetical protein SGCHY_002847 [Lobulomycetales sp.]